MLIELDRIDILNLLIGTVPPVGMRDNIPSELGEYLGGIIQKWFWYVNPYSETKSTMQYTNEELFELYKKIKNGTKETIHIDEQKAR